MTEKINLSLFEYLIMPIYVFSETAMRKARTAYEIAVFAMPHNEVAPASWTDALTDIFLRFFNVINVFCFTYYVAFIMLDKSIIYKMHIIKRKRRFGRNS